MPGVVSMPHGWGHGKAGTSRGALNGIPVTVVPIAE